MCNLASFLFSVTISWIKFISELEYPRLTFSVQMIGTPDYHVDRYSFSHIEMIKFRE